MNLPRVLAAASVLILALWTKCLAEAAPDHPPAEGLVLWLDASDAATIKADDKGGLSQWRSKVGDVVLGLSEGDDSTRPALVEHAIHERAAIRFAGHRRLVADRAIRKTLGSATVFAVFQRLPEQVTKNKWQRLVSSQVDPHDKDTQLPNFHLLSDESGESHAAEPSIVHREFGAVQIGTIAVGASAGGGNEFHGDVAEVLVYDRGFLSEGEQRLVLDYLHAKWNAQILETGWTRTGDLGTSPSHVRQDLPLSDQTNQGHWKLDPKFSDEFDGPSLDLNRWHLDPTAPTDWKGRQPALFMPSNIEQKDGMLRLTFRKGDVPEMKQYKGYGGYTSGLIRSNECTGYGYYEIRAKPMPSAASSSFWFAHTGLGKNETEIDVFEIGAKGKGFERKYNMNAHVWRTPEENRHWAVGGVWNAPWNFGDDFHVYGFDWSKDWLVWSVDGVVVRRARNTNWYYPMQVIIDTEAMFTWFGKVDDADLPSTFNVDYLRVWRHSDQP